jgi:hypothetical protein
MLSDLALELIKAQFQVLESLVTYTSMWCQGGVGMQTLCR